MFGLVVLLLLGGRAAAVSRLEAWGENAIRVRVAAPGLTDVVDPPIVALKGSAGASDAVSLTHGNLRVDVDPATSLMTATRVSDGATLLRQTALEWRAATPGAREGSRAAVATFAGVGADERVYGLGEHRDGRVQRAPFARVFADSLDYARSRGADVTVPWYVSTRGYAFVWHSPALGAVALDAGAITWVANATRGVDVWLAAAPAGAAAAADAGAALRDLLGRYAAAVGPPRPMPYWATGFIQCKDRYRNQTQLLDVARGYRARGLPIAMIVIDWFHWEQMGDFALNPDCWPDPAGMVAELQQRNDSQYAASTQEPPPPSAAAGEPAGAGAAGPPDPACDTPAPRRLTCWRCASRLRAEGWWCARAQ